MICAYVLLAPVLCVLGVGDGSRDSYNWVEEVKIQKEDAGSKAR